jgi:hypothetical protein
MEVIRLSEASVHIRTTRYYIIEDGNINDYRCEIIKSYLTLVIRRKRDVSEGNIASMFSDKNEARRKTSRRRQENPACFRRLFVYFSALKAKETFSSETSRS